MIYTNNDTTFSTASIHSDIRHFATLKLSAVKHMLQSVAGDLRRFPETSSQRKAAQNAETPGSRNPRNLDRERTGR